MTRWSGVRACARRWPWALPLVVWGVPWTAHAQAPQRTAMNEAVLLLLMVGGAYLLANLVVVRLQRRLMVVAGAEYIAVGVLLGPLVPAIHAFEDLGALLPVIALAAGWMGLLRGMDLHLRTLADGGSASVRLALGDDVLAGVVVAAGTYALFSSGLLGTASAAEIQVSAGALGCIAATTSTDPVEVVRQRYTVDGPLVPLLDRTSRLGDSLALFVFGLLFCIYHVVETEAVAVLSPTEWAVVAILIGATLGLMFRYFVGAEGSENARFLTLVGIITFASGAAWFLSLSPLLINLVLGLVLVNTAPATRALRETLERTEKPMSLVLLIVAGALWQPPAPLAAAFEGLDGTTAGAGRLAVAIGFWVLFPLAAFSLLRIVGKLIGSRLAAWGRPQRPDLWRGLVGHGHVTVAMAISFRLVYDGLFADIAYTTVVLAVVVHNLIAPRALRALLVDAGDLRRELVT